MQMKRVSYFFSLSLSFAPSHPFLLPVRRPDETRRSSTVGSYVLSGAKCALPALERTQFARVSGTRGRAVDTRVFTRGTRYHGGD